ncbi:MAG: hypothetical protein ACOYT4_00675 [Nanoarchaeota archaeon]
MNQKGLGEAYAFVHLHLEPFQIQKTLELIRKEIFGSGLFIDIYSIESLKEIKKQRNLKIPNSHSQDMNYLFILESPSTNKASAEYLVDVTDVFIEVYNHRKIERRERLVLYKDHKNNWKEYL